MTLWALHQQRLFLRLTYDAELGRRTRPLLSREARATVDARRRLVALTPPTKLPPLPSAQAALPARTLLQLYRGPERRFGVDWEVLAAVSFVETAFNKLRSRSSAGAQGPCSSCRRRGARTASAATSTGRETRSSAPPTISARRAPHATCARLSAYNRSYRYVDAVAAFAAQIRRDIRIFFAYHAWQVFIKTPAGPRRITGP